MRPGVLRGLFEGYLHPAGTLISLSALSFSPHGVPPSGCQADHLANVHG
jgi:hypothetical protein